MERIFKIKTKTDRVPTNPYPSERRYSASMVIGLSVVFLQLFLYSILMGSLIVYKMTIQPLPNTTLKQNTTSEDLFITTNVDLNNSNTILLQMVKLQEKVDKDLNVIMQRNKEILEHNSQHQIKIPLLMCSGCFLMALGYILGFGTGLLAWKHWYIDHNITIFFLASVFSTLTATVSLMLSILTFNFDYDTYTYEVSRVSPITFSVAMNITILGTIGVIWSLLSAKVAYTGMRSSYPDDMVFKGGRFVQVSTERKGSKNCAVFPKDIIEHFPSGDKLAKYLPKKDNGNLPKLESTLEYQQRVDRFLSEVPENTDKHAE